MRADLGTMPQSQIAKSKAILGKTIKSSGREIRLGLNLIVLPENNFAFNLGSEMRESFCRIFKTFAIAQNPSLRGNKA